MNTQSDRSKGNSSKGGGHSKGSYPNDRFTIDCLQYANWSEKIFRQMSEGGVDAVHVTIAYHENFRETVLNVEQWNRWFEQYPDLICHARNAADIQAAKAAGFWIPESVADRG